MRIFRSNKNYLLQTDKEEFNMSLSKETKIRVLENFYSLDYALFGKPAKKMESCCPAVLEDYINTKSALLSIMIEMYRLVGHSPTPLKGKLSVKHIVENAKSSAKISRENCKKLVASEQGRQDIKDELKSSLTEDTNVDVDDLVQEKIRNKAYSLALDNLLIARTLTETTEQGIARLNETDGRIIEDAYKVLRDSLVESASLIIDLNQM